MTGKLSKNFHGVGIGPLSKIYAVNVISLARVSLLVKKDGSMQLPGNTSLTRASVS